MELTKHPADTIKEPAILSSKPTEPVAEPPRKTVSIQIVNEPELEHCNFWIGLFNKGQLKTNQIDSAKPITAMLEEIAQKGLDEDMPIMMSDSRQDHNTKFVYLLPKPMHDIQAHAALVHSVVKTVKSWSPAKVGLYVCPQLIEKVQTAEILEQALRELISETNISDYFLLPGQYGLNTMLNISLKIKAELEQSKLSVYVFH